MTPMVFVLAAELVLLVMTLAASEVQANKEDGKLNASCANTVSYTSSELDVFNILLKPLHLRTSEEIELVNRYKNPTKYLKPGMVRTRAGRSVDLLDPSLAKVSQDLVHHQRANALIAPDARWSLTLYDEVVLKLRAYDTIAYESKQLRLGEYLGVDSRSHIYELDGNPEWTVRIPFNITSLGLKARVENREFQANMLRFPSAVPRVGIKAGPDGAFTLIERVHGNEDGRTFLFSHGPLTAARQKKRKRLILLVDEALASDVIREQAAHWLRTDMAQHFVWDNNKQDWILTGY